VDYTSRIAGAFPKTTIIVAHMGRYLCTDRGLLNRFIELAEKHENVILDTSGVVIPGKVAEAVHRIGSDRMAWGTDGPYPAPDLADFAKEEIDRIRVLPISEKDKENLFWGTIARLLKLE
jgi:predicted TIM-barrel fold metal-dependent hydrolase